jgi:phosphatidylserine/phosphatidylglycerophosphate/cardiolipin synthase-like enzyme
VFERVRAVAPDRVAVFDLENARGYPVYVHAKICIIDDVWMMVGSDNLNRRSWTNDSELSCAVLDDERDDREPLDPAGLGDGARRLARDTRLRLWREHLGRDVDDDADLVDLGRGYDALLASAHELDAWHDRERHGPRPAGRLRVHRPEQVPAYHAWWANVVYRTLVDPDGRPAAQRRMRRY